MADPTDQHRAHDPLLIAALVGDDVSGSERAAAEAQIAECHECATLHADLRALAAASTALPAPARTRDFTLTPADVERLRRLAPTEPIAAATRLDGVMTDPLDPSLPPGRTARDRHASHDTVLVASLADHSIAPKERAAAEQMISVCHDCAALHQDLLAIRGATVSLPTPVRPRDFTLTPDDAARLRPTGWRRLIAFLGSSRDGLTQPLALGMTTLGIAGLLLSSLPSLIVGLPMAGSVARDQTTTAPISQAVPEAGTGGGAAPGVVGANGAPAGAITDTSGPGAAAAPSPANVFGPLSAPAAGGAASAAPAAPGAADSASPVPAAAAPETSDRYTAVNGGPQIQASPPSAAEGWTKAATPPADDATSQLNADTTDGGLLSAETAQPGVSMVVVLSAAFLVTGLGLFFVRWSARRLRRS